MYVANEDFEVEQNLLYCVCISLYIAFHDLPHARSKPTGLPQRFYLPYRSA